MTNANYSGIGFIGALFLLFLGLKLGNVITWSWWWIASPLWIPMVLVIILMIIALITGFSMSRCSK